METSPLEWVLLTTNGTYTFHFLKQTSLLFILLFFSHHTSIPPINPIDSTSEHVQFLWNRDFSHFPAISRWSKPSSFIQTIQYPLHRFSNLWPCIIFFFWKSVLTLPTYIDFLQKKQPEWCSAKNQVMFLFSDPFQRLPISLKIKNAQIIQKAKTIWLPVTCPILISLYSTLCSC